MNRSMMLSGIVALALPLTASANGVMGTVKFTGTPPKAKPIQMSADPSCMKLHAKPLSTEYVIVNANGTLMNVFVTVTKGLEGKTFPTPTTAGVFDQSGCQYKPHVFGLMVGQPLEIRNSDPTLHNVHAMPKDNKEFNNGMPVQNMKITRKFDKPETGVKFKCDVHPWMSAFAHVSSHPYFSVTGDTGAYEIKDLPAGAYTITAWHEKYGTQEQTVNVEAAKPATVDFTFQGVEKAASAN